MRLRIENGRLVNTSSLSNPLFIHHLTRAFCKELGLNYSELSGLLTYFNDWLYYGSKLWPLPIYCREQKLGDFELGLKGFQELCEKLQNL